MEILIIRHGQAVDDAPELGDAGRWLTGKGRKVTRRVARWLAKQKDRRPAAIWTSPLVRSVQTAEILAEAAELTDEVSVVAELSPSRDTAELLRLLSQHQGPQPLALVGHEPSLSTLVTSLLGDVGWTGLKKSGVVAVSWDGRGPGVCRFALDLKAMKAVNPMKEAPQQAPRSR
ncbi:phosphohistidine phosphatase [Sorangium cellulosum]|uniref:Phosphohistidine phosphatase n=1 Tax=Sorangium cellulosum TaxID=56 RepID=A0A2L0F2H1_SORCE|nr:phosphohistidine phosphatase SixA [Sorangium cellulosum]AUX45737.1 phosphohistidine phosphatase [Sorangium cellulosum]